MRAAVVVTIGLGALCVSGCGGADSSDLPGSGLDCVARIRFDGVVYEPNSDLRASAPRGKPLGSGSVVDCDRQPVRAIRVFAVRGVDPAQAITTVPGHMHAIYVDESMARADWPAAIRRR